MPNRAQRISIVNEIIKEISSYDRHFFKGKNGTSYIKSMDDGTLVMYNEYSGELMNLEKNEMYQPDGFPHGGTMWGLVKDFMEYINGGFDVNGNNGYGGLYCKAWGYNDESMDKIRNKAKELGYLKN